jgi:hypothetical protein
VDASNTAPDRLERTIQERELVTLGGTEARAVNLQVAGSIGADDRKQRRVEARRIRHCEDQSGRPCPGAVVLPPLPPSRTLLPEAPYGRRPWSSPSTCHPQTPSAPLAALPTCWGSRQTPVDVGRLRAARRRPRQRDPQEARVGRRRRQPLPALAPRLPGPPRVASRHHRPVRRPPTGAGARPRLPGLAHGFTASVLLVGRPPHCGRSPGPLGFRCRIRPACPRSSASRATKLSRPISSGRTTRCTSGSAGWRRSRPRLPTPSSGSTTARSTRSGRSRRARTPARRPTSPDAVMGPRSETATDVATTEALGYRYACRRLRRPSRAGRYNGDHRRVRHRRGPT